MSKANQITKSMAKEFYRDLRGSMRFDPDSTATHGIVSPALAADHLCIDEATASAYLWACVKYEITDRQGGGFVV